MANRGDPRLKRAYRDGFRTMILQRDGYVCFYCGQDADQVDHVIPISRAPELVVSPDNAVACCKRCNTRKGNRSQGVFLATSATPPVFSGCLSPMQSKVHQDSPFTARPNPDQA
jgi:5-methylcytosine-specific restriction endonuclease McrA